MSKKEKQHQKLDPKYLNLKMLTSVVMTSQMK